MNNQRESQLDKQWQKVLKKTEEINPQPRNSPISTRWDYQITPGLPTHWPLIPQSSLFYYVYGHGFRISLMDGVVIGTPWARLEQSLGAYPPKPPVFQILVDSVEQIGIQGVRPISAEEAAVSKLEEAVKKNLFSLENFTDPDSPALHQLVQFYKQWKKYNGVIANHLRQFHEVFFALLEA